MAVTDSKGNYITGLRPEDFAITEDKIPQKTGHVRRGQTSTGAPGRCRAQAGKVAGNSGDERTAASGHQLFGCQDFAAGGRQRLHPLRHQQLHVPRLCLRAGCHLPTLCARWMMPARSRFTPTAAIFRAPRLLTADRFHVVNGVRSTVAGDDAALYNSLLLTVKDAAQLTGRKAIVVFSNGPDNASSVPPEDVAELAQSTGTIIYIVSTRQAQDDLVSAAAFERMSKSHRRQSLLRRQLAQGETGLRLHPQRPGASLLHQLLSATQPQPRLAHHQRQARRQGPAEVPHSHARRLQPAAADAGKQRGPSGAHPERRNEISSGSLLGSRKAEAKT